MKIGDKVFYKSREYKIIYIYKNGLNAEIVSLNCKCGKFELVHISHLKKPNLELGGIPHKEPVY